MGESKKKILASFPAKYTPITLSISENAGIATVKNQMQQAGLGYPVIAKPDVGERGSLVEKIDHEQALTSYLLSVQEPVLIQEFIDYPIELGVLYHKKPGASGGQISSVVRKGFLQVVGDGNSTLKALLEREVRAAGRMSYLEKKLGKAMKEVPQKGESILVEPIGNHCRGTAFYNGNELITSRLTGVFDRIAENIPGFYYGRFDLKVKSIDDLYRGENIKILELNGVSSEPAHVYDPEYTLLRAYRDIINHMNIICQIARINHRLGHKRASIFSFAKDLKKHFNRKSRRKAIEQPRR